MQLITDLKDLPIQPCMRLFHSKLFNSELAAERLPGWVIRLYVWHHSDIPKPAICLVDRILSSSGTFFLLMFAVKIQPSSSWWKQFDMLKMSCGLVSVFDFLVGVCHLKSTLPPLRNLWFQPLHLLSYVVHFLTLALNTNPDVETMNR